MREPTLFVDVGSEAVAARRPLDGDAIIARCEGSLGDALEIHLIRPRRVVCGLPHLDPERAILDSGFARHESYLPPEPIRGVACQAANDAHSPAVYVEVGAVRPPAVT